MVQISARDIARHIAALQPLLGEREGITLGRTILQGARILRVYRQEEREKQREQQQALQLTVTTVTTVTTHADDEPIFSVFSTGLRHAILPGSVQKRMHHHHPHPAS